MSHATLQVLPALAYAVRTVVIADGTVDQLTPTVADAMRRKVATELGVDVNAVTVSVEAASVRITLNVGYASASLAESGRLTLAQAVGTAEAASTFLSTSTMPVTVETTETVPTVVSPAGASDPPSTGLAAAEMGSAERVGSSVAGIVVLLLTLVICIWLHRRVKKKARQRQELEEAKPVKARIDEEKKEKACTFNFVTAAFIRSSQLSTLPRFQELKLMKGAIEQKKILFSAAYTGVLDRTKYLVVSHRWMHSSHPDQDGVQTSKIREYLNEHPEIEWVWYDFWSMPQGNKTEAEKLAFKWMLLQINVLYLGLNVLILLDLSYLSRFWTQYEAWLSIQQPTPNGLRPAHAKDRRSHVGPIYNTNANMVEGLYAMWSGEDPDQAHQLLSKPDVTVTNQSDKDEQLSKVLRFNEDIIVAFHYHKQLRVQSNLPAAQELAAPEFLKC